MPISDINVRNAIREIEDLTGSPPTNTSYLTHPSVLGLLAKAALKPCDASPDPTLGAATSELLLVQRAQLAKAVEYVAAAVLKELHKGTPVTTLGERIAARLLRTDAGQRAYSDEDLRAYLPVMLLRAGTISVDTDPALRQLVEGFLRQIAFRVEWTEAQFVEAVNQRIKACPILARLDRELGAVLSQHAAQTPFGTTRAMSQLLGTPTRARSPAATGGVSLLTLRSRAR